MSEYACLSLDAGARIIGGCSGTTPAHLKVMRQALERHTRGPRPDLAIIESRLGAISTGATAQLSGKLDRQAGPAPSRSASQPEPKVAAGRSSNRQRVKILDVGQRRLRHSVHRWVAGLDDVVFVRSVRTAAVPGAEMPGGQVDGR